MNPVEKLERLIEVLNLLAAQAEDQLAAFPSFTHRPDEIVLTFDDGYTFADELLRAGHMDSNEKGRLDQISQHISLMGKEPNIWTEDAVRTSTRWAELRDLAQETLCIMGRTPRKANLGWNTFVDGWSPFDNA